jgi:HK97 family phage major capsid protein
MKKYLEKLIAAKKAKAEELRSLIKAAQTADEVRSLGDTLQAVLDELKDAEEQLANAEDDGEGNGAAASNDPAGEGRGVNPMREFRTLANYAPAAQTADYSETREYRSAFQSYIATGDAAQLRAAAGNTTGGDNVGTVIPANLVTKIMEKLESVGTIYKLVNKTAFPVGQTIPREALKPVATWVGVTGKNSGEGLGSTVGKGATLDAAIVFAHFKLRCEVAMTEEVAQMSLPSFEALFINNVSLAMLRAVEFAIVEGTGVGQPTGILTAAVPAGQAITIATASKLGYADLCNAEAAIPALYEAGAKWCMTKKTFMAFVGMTDNNGQPIARVNYGVDGKPERVLLGREVVLYEPQAGSKIGNYADTVNADTLFAFIFNFGDYTLNNNYDLGIQHKVDWDNEDHRTKAVAAYDGKVVDNGSLVTLTKAAKAS